MSFYDFFGIGTLVVKHLHLNLHLEDKKVLSRLAKKNKANKVRTSDYVPWHQSLVATLSIMIYLLAMRLWPESDVSRDLDGNMDCGAGQTNYSQQTFCYTV